MSQDDVAGSRQEHTPRIRTRASRYLVSCYPSKGSGVGVGELAVTRRINYKRGAGPGFNGCPCPNIERKGTWTAGVSSLRTLVTCL
jgi:hypothetical protein